MNIASISFFWKNNTPEGMGFTFGPPSFTPEMLTEMFHGGEVVKNFFRESDAAMGTRVIADYTDQLDAIAKAIKKNGTPPLPLVIMAALNILWLHRRGFMLNDEFNGVQIVTTT